jgi:hypothetical protein
MRHIFKASYLFVVLTTFIQLGCKTEKITKFDRESTEIIQKFLGRLGNDGQAALNDLLKSNPNISLADSSTINLINRFKIVNEYSGKYLESGLIKSKKIGDDVAIYSYLVKYEKKFYRFVFIFYRTYTVNIFKFSFDDEIDFELEQALKLYF